MNKGSLAGLQAGLLAWFAEEQRRFPWRSTTDPYAILVAEKLLQQTAARGHVVAAYESILTHYPSPSELASADARHLQGILAPLGLRYRARELIRLAEALVEHHAGRVPCDFGALTALPGIGEYIARAVLSFAFGEDVAVVDTNVARFLYRVFGLEGPMPANPARKRALSDLAATLLPPGRSREFNLAVLDLCAGVCTPRTPSCSSCPVAEFCHYGSDLVALVVRP